MSEKHLTELPWKTLAIKKHIKDGEVAKTLAAYSKAADDDFASKVKCLDRLVTLASTLRKEQKADAEVATYLDELVKEAKKTKTTLAPLQKTEVKTDGKEASKESEEEEEVDDSAEEMEAFRKNYKGKLSGALSQVKSRAPVPGQAAKPQLKFMVYTAGKQSSVVIAPSVAGSARPLLLALLGGTAGGQYLAGECIFEKNAFTFVVPAASSGLAGKLSRAISGQLGTKVPIRVRTVAGEEEPEDEESEATDAPDPAAQFQSRLSALNPALEAALQEQRGDTGKMRAVVAFAREKASAGTYAAALQALGALETLLATAGASASTSSDDGGEFSKVEFETIHLDWDARKQQVQSRLDELQRAIAEDDEDPQATAAVAKLRSVLGRFNEGLGDTVDLLRNSESREERAALAKKAIGITDQYLEYLGGKLVAHIEANPFEIAVPVKETLSAPLAKLRAGLSPLAT